MKILAVSDMHGELGNVVRALDKSPADLLLCCGDWGDPDEIDEEIFTRILAHIPVLSVYGNHDDMELLSNAKNTDGSSVLLESGEVRRRDGLQLTGISGIWAKTHKEPYYITDEEVAQIAGALADAEVDVLLTHGCAIGLADAVPGGRRGGQRCFLNAFHAIAPRLYLCGHLHVPEKRVLKDGRTVVNVGYTHDGDYWTFDLNEESITAEHHRPSVDR